MRSDWHDHHAHQLTLALEGEFFLRTTKSEAPARFTAAIVPSHVRHEFEVDGATIAQLFVEPESVEGRALSRRFSDTGISVLPERACEHVATALLDALRRNADAVAMKSLARSAVVTLAGTTPHGSEGADDRIARSLDYIRSRVRGPLTLAEAATATSLSPSRFRHLFVKETGTSFRAYLLWLRINVAIESAMSGASWTDAAHAAGFSDSSHLSRTHRRMFGIEPTAIRRA